MAPRLTRAPEPAVLPLALPAALLLAVLLLAALPLAVLSTLLRPTGAVLRGTGLQEAGPAGVATPPSSR